MGNHQKESMSPVGRHVDPGGRVPPCTCESHLMNVCEVFRSPALWVSSEETGATGFSMALCESHLEIAEISRER